MRLRAPTLGAPTRLLIVACALGACGTAPHDAASGAPTSATEPVPAVPPLSSDPASATTLPATTVVDVSGTIDTGSLVVEPVAVSEPCPESDPDRVRGDGFAEAGRLGSMIEHVRVYGTQHPDEFGTYGVVWHGGGDASVLISFTENVDVHRSALLSDVEYPDELIVCQAAITGDIAHALVTELVDELSGRFRSINRGLGPIHVVLCAGEETLADQLLHEFGDAVSVTIWDQPNCQLEVVPEPNVPDL